MKALKLITFVIAISLTQSCTVNRQRGTFTEYFKTHKRHDEFSGFRIPSWLVRLLLINQDEKEIRKLFRSVHRIKLMSYKGSFDVLEYYTSELEKTLSPCLYKDLIVLNNGGDKVTIKVRTKNKTPRELLMVTADSSDFFYC